MIIDREFNGINIPQRVIDGYINVSSMCQSCDESLESLEHYLSDHDTRQFLNELAADLKYPITELVKTIHPDPDAWAHPKVAINLAHRLSPKLTVQVIEWVHEYWASQQIRLLPAPLVKHDSEEKRFNRFAAEHLVSDVGAGIQTYHVAKAFDQWCERNGYPLPNTILQRTSLCLYKQGYRSTSITTRSGQVWERIWHDIRLIP